MRAVGAVGKEGWESDSQTSPCQQVALPNVGQKGERGAGGRGESEGRVQGEFFWMGEV